MPRARKCWGTSRRCYEEGVADKDAWRRLPRFEHGGNASKTRAAILGRWHHLWITRCRHGNRFRHDLRYRVETITDVAEILVHRRRRHPAHDSTARRLGKVASCNDLRRLRCINDVIAALTSTSQSDIEFLVSTCLTRIRQDRIRRAQERCDSQAHHQSEHARGTFRFPSPRSPNSSGSSASSTKRLRASPPPKPTPKRTSKTPAPSSKATSNPSSPSAARGGWRRQLGDDCRLQNRLEFHRGRSKCANASIVAVGDLRNALCLNRRASTVTMDVEFESTMLDSA